MAPFWCDNDGHAGATADSAGIQLCFRILQLPSCRPLTSSFSFFVFDAPLTSAEYASQI